VFFEKRLCFGLQNDYDIEVENRTKRQEFNHIKRLKKHAV